MTDETDDDSQPVTGEIVGPEGNGSWVSVPDAFRLTGKSTKTLYRQIEHNRIPWRKNDDGRFEVWVAGASPAPSPTDMGLSPIVSVNTVELRELLAPLAQALTDSQREALTATARAARLEKALETAHDEIRALRARQSRSRPGRLDALRSWWRFWILGQTDDSRDNQ